MADDIVTRLQDLTTDLLYNPDCDDEGCGDCAWHRAVMAAIAEIERLRADIAELWEFIDESPDGADLWNAWMGRTWEEARRG